MLKIFFPGFTWLPTSVGSFTSITNECQKAVYTLTSPYITDDPKDNPFYFIPPDQRWWHEMPVWEGRSVDKGPVRDFHTRYELENRVQISPSASGMRHLCVSFLILPQSSLCSYLCMCAAQHGKNGGQDTEKVCTSRKQWWVWCRLVACSSWFSSGLQKEGISNSSRTGQRHEE